MTPTVEQLIERVPPQNLEAEMAVLGSMLIDEEAVPIGVEALAPSAFYREAHRKVFEAMVSLFSRQKAVDLVTVTEELKASGRLEGVGGAHYLASLTTVVPTAANVLAYAKIVKEKGLLRSLINTSTQIVGECYENQDDVESLLDKAEQILFEITTKSTDSRAIFLKEMLKDSIETIERLYQRKELVTGISTGLHDLDVQTAGLQPADLIIAAGRPSMGKSALVTCIAEHVGIVERIPVVIFSLEMSKEQLVHRMLCAHARVDVHKARTGFLSQSDWPRLTNAAGKLSEAPILVDDTPTISALELRAKARRLKSQHQVGLVIVDYLQMMRGSFRAENRQQEIAEISRSLKALAKELRVPVIAVSQLSRAPEQREDRRPQLSDLRECLSGETEILHAETGQRYRIKDLYEKRRKIPVFTLSSDWTLQTVIPEKIVQSGIKRIYRLRTATGREIRASGNHPFLTIQGWTPLENLQLGERIAVPRQLPVADEGWKISTDQARLLGYLIGDGSYGRHRTVGLVNRDRSVIEDARGIAREEFGIPARDKAHWTGTPQLEFTVPNGYGPGKNPLINWLKALGIHGQLGPEKRVPEAVFQGSPEVVSAFLGGAYATDGSVARCANRFAVKYCSTSLLLLCDLQMLLLRLGIISVMGKPTRHTKSKVDIAQLVITGREQISRFIERVPIPGRKGQKAQEALQWASERRFNHHIDRLPLEITQVVRQKAKGRGLSWKQLGYRCQGKEMDRGTLERVAATLSSPQLTQLARSDVLWDRVVSIEPSGDETTYDLVIPRTRNFVANNIVVHNSGSIEQDADVVLLLFREEVYHPTDENRGRSEIHIAKQRNGPVGSIPLVFLKEFTRFENLSPRAA